MPEVKEVQEVKFVNISERFEEELIISCELVLNMEMACGRLYPMESTNEKSSGLVEESKPQQGMVAELGHKLNRLSSVNQRLSQVLRHLNSIV